MTQPGRRGDIPIDAPLAKHADVVPAVEDRSYMLFIGGALAVAILGGFVLAVVTALAQSGLVWSYRTPWLIQAHGWAQLEGWAGLFVAGMSLRLLPRFAGRRPLPRKTNFVIFALLFAAVVLRTVAQPAAANDFARSGLLAGQILWAAGATTLATIVLNTLLRGRKRTEPWSIFSTAGAVWWLAWAVASVVAGVRAARNDAYVPTALDDAMTWMVMLGAVGNFIWGVQSRSVPIFFGRKTPTLRQVIIPAAMLNTGVACIFAAGWLDANERLMNLGFALAGVALIWLAPRAGSCWGTAKRLRPRARAAARFVLAANISAVVCGVLLLWASLLGGDYGVHDAARHAFGLGVITMLIVGMAQLVAPFFALRRIESNGDLIMDHAVLWLLVSATILRVGEALLSNQLDLNPRMHTAALAGSLAWLALVLFAATVAHAIRSAPRIQAGIAVAAGVQPPK